MLGRGENAFTAEGGDRVLDPRIVGSNEHSIDQTCLRGTAVDVFYQRAAAEIEERLSGETLRVEAGRYDRYCSHSTRKCCGDFVVHSQSYLRRIFGVNNDLVLAPG